MPLPQILEVATDYFFDQPCTFHSCAQQQRRQQ